MDELHDLELDSEGHGGMTGGAVRTVRKTIPLNLTKKTKLKAKGSVKSGRYKKEKRDKEEDIIEAKRRTKTIDKKRDAKTDEDEREDEELDWFHKVVFVGEKIQNPMIHVCEQCNLPILIYGRLIHCKHILCYTCAGKANGTCPHCKDRIVRIEPAGIGQIFVCTYGGSSQEISQCRRSYLSQRDLIAHIRHRHEKEGSTIPDSELQQGLGLPVNGTTNMMVQQPPINMPSASQANPINPVMMPGMPPQGQPPMFVDANRMPIHPQPQFQQMSQPLPQGMPQPRPQAMQPTMQQMQQTMAQSMPQPMPQSMPHSMPQSMPQPMPPTMPQSMPQAMPQSIPQPMPQAMSIPQAQYQPQSYIPHSQYQNIPPQQPQSIPNNQPQVPRPEDMQGRTSGPMPPAQQQVPPPPPPHGDWRGAPQPPMTGTPADWVQPGRTGNYQPQNFYK